MGLAQDIAAFEAKLGAAVEDTMEREVFLNAGLAIVQSVFPNVYERYDPDEYVRRYEEGGLADPRNMEITERRYDRAGGRYEIEVRNTTEGVDGEGPIDQVIEKGVGYDWKGSRIYRQQPYPRPFYEAAEKIAAEGGYVESALRDGLRRHGMN